MTCEELKDFKDRLYLVQKEAGHVSTGNDSINTTHSINRGCGSTSYYT
jgi:hypothetical protein